MGPAGKRKAISRALTTPGESGASELAEELRYVARQPILDLRDRIYAYELLFRDGPGTAFRGEGNMATRTMLDNSVLFGVEKFTGGLPAFVNCTLEALTEKQVTVLPPAMTVLEILETVEPTPALVAACRQLKKLGFKLALDDFIWEPRFAPLVELADYIKVDFILSDAAARKKLLGRLKGRKTKLLAEKVETAEDHRQARAEGFTLFQGYYFCRPQLMKSVVIPHNALLHFEILQLLQADPINLHELSRLVKREQSLSYRLLHMVNSAGYGMSEAVSSIQEALMIVGEETFRRIAQLAIATELCAGRSGEILNMSLIRARFCELGAQPCSLSPGEQYLLGMFSLLPAMLRIPMEELTPRLPIRSEIRSALEGVPNRERGLLAWIEACERADWKACGEIAGTLGIEQERLNESHAQAVLWADQSYSLAG